MITPPPQVDLAAATRIARAVLKRPISVTAARPLHGGMVHTVQEWETDGEPRLLVAKLSAEQGNVFDHESRTLSWYRRHTRLPVPEPYGALGDAPLFAGSCLLMERVAGRNLAEARLTEAGARHFEEELASCLAELHGLGRETYGDALDGPAHAKWLDWFAPRLQSNLADAAPRLSPRARRVTERLLANLATWLPECHRPTLVHGDLWATNIIVDDADPDRPRITGFVDGNALYCDVEYELAYLRVFNTAGRAFFEAYAQRRPLRAGFERRCRVYWLNTLLLHVWLFGDEYLPRCERLAQEVERLE